MNKVDWAKLSQSAWTTRENAMLMGRTKVGAALISENGNIYSGCNIEQRYRNKDIHAEVCAIAKMISEGEKKFIAILVAADRDRFTPCGTCLDWIFQFGGEETIVGYQREKDGDIITHSALELMPFYPR